MSKASSYNINGVLMLMYLRAGSEAWCKLWIKDQRSLEALWAYYDALYGIQIGLTTGLSKRMGMGLQLSWVIERVTFIICFFYCGQLYEHVVFSK
jgi:hypothetical protein